MGWVFKRPGRSRGQSLVEFALVFPVLIAILGGIIQFGMIFWAQNTLTQVVRDTGRWAATQQGCALGTGNGQTDVLKEANSVAGNASLIGYPAASPWTATDLTDRTSNPVNYSTAGDAAVNGFNPVSGEGVAVAWVKDSDPNPTPKQVCPPQDNQAVYHVTIKIVHSVPVFFPGMQYLPGFAGNKVVLSSTAQFRMEPKPAP